MVAQTWRRPVKETLRMRPCELKARNLFQLPYRVELYPDTIHLKLSKSHFTVFELIRTEKCNFDSIHLTLRA